MTDPIPDRTVFMAAARRQCEIDYPGQDVSSSLVASYANDPGFRAAVDSAYRQGRDDEAAGLDRAKAKAAIHPVLHDLDVRINGLAVGDCHCNLIAEVVLDALGAPPVPDADGDPR